MKVGDEVDSMARLSWSFKLENEPTQSTRRLLVGYKRSINGVRVGSFATVRKWQVKMSTFGLLTYLELYLVSRIDFAGKFWCQPGQPHCPLSIAIGSLARVALVVEYGMFKV